MSKASIFRGTLLLSGASLILRAVSMLFQIWLSARVGAAGLGLLQLISTVGGLALTLGAAGLRVCAMYLTAEELSRGGGVRCAMRWCLGTALGLSAAAGILLYALAPFLAVSWIRDVQAVSSLRLIALSLPVPALLSVLTGYFTTRGKIPLLVASELGEQALTVAVTMALLRQAAGLSDACLAIFGGGIAAELLNLFVLLGCYRRDARDLPAGRRAGMGRRMLRLCLPLAANGWLRAALSALEHLLIPRGLQKSGDSAAEAMETFGTIHGMVFPVVTFPSVFLTSLSEVLVPELARCRAAGNTRRILHLTDTCLRFGSVFSLGAAALLFGLSGPLGNLLYRSAEASDYIAVFAPLVPVLYLDAVVDGMHKGLGEQLACVRYGTATSLLDVAMLFFLLPRCGIFGYLASFAVAHLLNFFLGLRRLLRVTGYVLPLPFLLRTSLFAAVCAAAARRLSARSGSLGAALLLAAAELLLFLLLLGVTKTFTGADLRWLRALLRREKAPPDRGSPAAQNAPRPRLP